MFFHIFIVYLYMISTELPPFLHHFLCQKIQCPPEAGQHGIPSHRGAVVTRHDPWKIGRFDLPIINDYTW